MSWQILIGLSILLYSVNYLLHRILMKEETADGYTQAVVFTFLVGVISSVILGFRGGFHSYIGWNNLPIFSAFIALNAIAWICAFKATKLVDASEYVILLTSSQLWVILGAIFFLAENPTIQKLIGAGLVLFGVGLTQWKGTKFVLNTGSSYALLAASFFAFGQLISFYILRNFDVFSFMVYASFATAFVLILAYPRVVKKLRFYLQSKRAINIVVTSTNHMLASLFSFMAYQVGRNALQIGPLGAIQTIVTVLLAITFLKERDYLVQKIIGSLVAVVGAICLL